MKKLITTILLALAAALSWGQLTFVDNGDAIGVTGGGITLNFSKSGLLIFTQNNNLMFTSGGHTYRYPFVDIDTPAYSTLDSVYTEVASWLSGTYVFTGGITGDTAIFDYIEGDTVQINKMLQPDANDGAPLGYTTRGFSDLFLAEGGVINWDNGDATLTQVGNMVTLAGADLTAPTVTVTTLTDGTLTTTGGILSGAQKITADSITDGTFLATAGVFSSVSSVTATTLTDGSFSTTAGSVTGFVSLTDGTASWNTAQQLTGFNTVSADTITDGTATMISGSLDVTDITVNTPVNVYLLSHNSFADYVAQQHFYQATIDSVNTSLTGALYATSGVLSALDTMATPGLATTYSVRLLTDGSIIVSDAPLSNVGIGTQVLLANTVGTFNTAVGYQALVSSTGTDNTAIGANALRQLVTGNYNTVVGSEAGMAAIGSGNVFLGYQAGYNESGDNLLYIENSNSATPLIWGDFAADSVVINGNLNVTGSITGITGSNWTVTGDTIEPNTATLIYTTGDVYGDTAKFLHYGGHSPFSIGIESGDSLVQTDYEDMIYWKYQSVVTVGDTSAEISASYEPAIGGSTTYDNCMIHFGADNVVYGATVDIYPKYIAFDADSLDIQGNITATGDVTVTGKVAASDSLCIGKFRFIVRLDTLCAITGTDTVRVAPPR